MQELGEKGVTFPQIFLGFGQFVQEISHLVNGLSTFVIFKRQMRDFRAGFSPILTFLFLGKMLRMCISFQLLEFLESLDQSAPPTKKRIEKNLKSGLRPRVTQTRDIEEVEDCFVDQMGLFSQASSKSVDKMSKVCFIEVLAVTFVQRTGLVLDFFKVVHQQLRTNWFHEQVLKEPLNVRVHLHFLKTLDFKCSQ